MLEQRIGRIYRLGQSRPIDVYNLVSEPGIESRIADLVGNKKALFTGLFDGTSDEVAFERSGTFLSRIERIVAPALAPAPARARRTAADSDDESRRARDRRHRGGGGRVARRARAGPARAGGCRLAPDVQQLFAGLTVQRTARGGLVIEAPPETASTLAALFSGMAQLLQAAAPASPGQTAGSPSGRDGAG